MAIPIPRGANGEPMTDDRFLVALGCFDGITTSLHFGSNPEVGTTFEIVREAGTTHDFTTVATSLEVTSSDANDTSAGTGARAVLITGLDANFDVITETVVLNGQTPVATIAAFLRVNSTQVTNAGSGQSNAGDLYVADDSGTHTAGVPDDLTLVEEKIPIRFSLSEAAFFTVPRGFTFYVSNVEIFATAGKTVTFQGHLFIPALGTSGIETIFFEGVAQDTDFKLTRGGYVAVPGCATVWAEAKVDTGSAEVSMAIDGWLVDNSKILQQEGVA